MPELTRGSSRVSRAASPRRVALAGLACLVVLAGCSSTTWDTSEADSQAQTTVKH